MFVHDDILPDRAAGAVLIDLVTAEHITIRDGHILVYRRLGIGEPVADSLLAAIGGQREQRALRVWMQWIAEDIYERATGALIAAGVVVREVSRRHLIGRRERHVPTDLMIVSWVRGGVQYAVYGRESPDWQCVALCGLFGVLGLQDFLYLGGSSTQLRTRLREIGSWHHPDVQAILAAVDRHIGDVAVAAYR